MKCKSCLLELPVFAFYDSNKTKCKECVKAKVRANRMAKIEYYRSFDRARANLPHRVEARAKHRQTDEYKIQHAAACKKWSVSNATRRRAQNVVASAIRDGKVERQPCLICGAQAEAHHPDYSAPLAVSWLCSVHHAQTHKEFREYTRKKEGAPQ